jgi:undecaprenyl-diphosphatase
MDAWYLVTLAGDPQMWALSTVILAIAYLLLRKKLEPGKRKLFKRVLHIYVPGVITTLLIVLILKNAIIVERPCTPCGALLEIAENCNPYCETDSSFPSGHAAVIFSVVTSLYLGLEKRKFMLLYVISALVASSRYFLGVHRITDIIAGAVIGIFIPFVFSLVYRKEFGKPQK